MKNYFYLIIIAILVLSFALAQSAKASHEGFFPEGYNQAPQIYSEPVTFGQVGELYHYRVRAFDYNGDSLRYSLERAPEGMIIHPLSGQIEWIPSQLQTGTNWVLVWVEDGQSYSTQFFKVWVKEGFAHHSEQEFFDQGNQPVHQSPPVIYQPPAIQQTVFVQQSSASATSRADIFDIQVDTDKDNNVFINWQTTQPTRGRVVYGLASQADFDQNFRYEFRSPETMGLSSMHRVMLGPVQLDRTYYFRIVSTFGGEDKASSEMSFLIIPEASGRAINGSASAFGSLGNLVLSPALLMVAIIVLVIILALGRRKEIGMNDKILDKNEDLV